ncbi:MAG TPA: DUF4907 domain-containing protein [Sediminibacterium sp.]
MQTIKRYGIYLFFSGAVVFFLLTRYRREKMPAEEKIHLSMKTFQAGDGWGYDLYTNDSVYIHQEYIPSIAGRKRFATGRDAGVTGSLALAKLQKSRFPVISVEELDSLGVTR